MAISEEQIRTVMRLARLDAADAAPHDLAEQLGKILKYVEKLNELDTSQVPPTLQVAATGAPLRPDVVVPGVPREEALRAAARSSDQGFLVPAIIDES
jgi:aspartyl-tRNA(Asn)/glutamyl-tRNA(Gln) amidotransferase subunit C